MATFKTQKQDGTYSLLTTRDEKSAARFCSNRGMTLIGPCEGLKEDEELDQVTGEIRKRPVVEPGPTVDDRIDMLEAENADLKARIRAIEDRSIERA